MKNHEFQELVDQNLSGLVWDERKRQKVHHAISEEEKPVKKISTTFILVAAIVCLSATALAAGLLPIRQWKKNMASLQIFLASFTGR